ncbi:hypothetical protein WJX84_005251 [Apatococcus fuscideae]|uniref:ShKT domain-containing protein n=1 Tax=Apatococcus fuscideae TaxID=2026836 RepID=A0AAW1T2M8_9CHLO
MAIHQGSLLCLLGVVLHALAISAQAPAATVHTVITTECGGYFSWQTLGLVYSHRKAGQPGPLTRLLSCTEEQLKDQKDMDTVATHVAPSLTIDSKMNDVYSAYNKPGAVLHWLETTDVKEDYILVIDADMIMREPFIPEDVGVGPGWGLSAYFSYLKGVSNELAMKYVSWVPPRNDTYAGPVGRRGDMVGGFCLMYKEDMKRVAPLWLKYSRAVRHDPDAWNLTGDAFTKNPGDKPWISEMYGYSYGTAAADVWHKVIQSAHMYPGYFTTETPKVLHYGLLWDVPNTEWKFDKHWHYGFDAYKCPPWNLTTDRPTAGLFPYPPAPKDLKTRGFMLLRDLLAIEPIITLNAAFCERHLKACSPSEQLTQACTRARNMEIELDAAFAPLEAELRDQPCQDHQERCAMWARAGECKSNPGYMASSCAKSCKKCPPPVPKVPKKALPSPPPAPVPPSSGAVASPLILQASPVAQGDRPTATRSNVSQATGMTTSSGTQAASQLVSDASITVSPSELSTLQGVQANSAADKKAASDKEFLTLGEEAEKGQQALASPAVLHANPDEAALNDATATPDVKKQMVARSEKMEVDSITRPQLVGVEQIAGQGGVLDSKPLQKAEHRGDPEDLLLSTKEARELLAGRGRQIVGAPATSRWAGLATLLYGLGWLGLILWLALVAAILICLPKARRRGILRTKTFKDRN